MRTRDAICALACCLVLAGCATSPAVPPPQPLLLDAAFRPPAEAVDEASIMAPSEEMRRFIRNDMARSVQSMGPRFALVDALRKRSGLMLEYDAAYTRTAAEAFDARRGNCLSLVLMTAAMAHELGVHVWYQEVDGPQQWHKLPGLFVGTGHVNLTLARRLGDERDSATSLSGLTIDFLPGDDAAALHTTPISEATVLAMFMNNRAVEAILRGDLDSAYAWARAAVLEDRSFWRAYNTLAVIYLKHGDAAAAERVLRHLLTFTPSDPTASDNLQIALLARARRGAAGDAGVGAGPDASTGAQPPGATMPP